MQIMTQVCAALRSVQGITTQRNIAQRKNTTALKITATLYPDPQARVQQAL